MVHGGGLRVGARSMMEAPAKRLAGRGLTCITVEYRLLTESPWPAPLDDVRSAVWWVREHCDDLNIDPDRIVLYGESSGGHLALMVAATAVDHPGTEVSAVVSFYAPTVFCAGPVGSPMGLVSNGVTWAERPALGAYHLFDRDVDEEAATRVSPVALASPDWPPTLLFHGDADTIIDPAMTRELHAALVRENVPCDMHIFAGQIHHFDAAPSFAAIIDLAVTQFVDRTVVDPDAYVQEQRDHNFFVKLMEAQAGPPSDG
jgi:acetyl esterase/lipase